MILLDNYYHQILNRLNNREIIEKIAKTGLFFVLSKGVAFLAPIILVGFVPLLEYGKVEYCYGIGRLFQSTASLGLIGYAFFILKKNQRNKEIYFYAYGFFILLVSLLYLVGCCLWSFEDEILFSFLFVFMFAIQGLYSLILKTEDKGYKGVMFDSGYYFLLAIVILIKVVFIDVPILPCLSWMMWGYMTVLGLFFIMRYCSIMTNRHLSFKMSELKEVISYGIPLIVSGFFIYWLTSSARVYIGYFIGYEEVGIYSFYFRIVGISMVLQQFLYIALFKKLYMGSSSFLDKYYVTIMTAIFVLCVVTCLLSIPIIKYFLIDKEFTDYKLMLLLCVQMPMWVGISFCEGLIGRENIVMKMNMLLGLVTLCFAGFVIMVKDILNLYLFTLGMIIQFSVAFYFLLLLLKTVDVNLPMCRLFSFLSVLLGTLIYLFL